MKGDFSRIRLSEGTGYTAVLQQQGRVALDADANEQQFIDESLRRTETVDVIGGFGGPAGDFGFAITVTGDEISIGPGRYYVGGLVCENPAALSYDSQPFLVVTPQTDAAALLAGLTGGTDALQVYLYAWQRLVTALDDPCLREPALGQADTTARLQVVWQVVASVPLDPQPPGACCAAMYGSQPASSTGTLTVTTTGTGTDCGCGPVAAAGYQGIENQLYRVEIHTGGDETQATFKWSRENASVVSAVTGISGATVQVNSLGPDANLGYQVSQWVELTDDDLQFGSPPNAPGLLYQIQGFSPDGQSVTLSAPVTGIDPTRNARMRRWDQSGPTAAAAGIPLSAGTPLDLENGIQVTFAAGGYQPDDYWTIPARTATGQVEWPPCGSDGNPAQPPSSIEVLQAPLACLHWVEDLTRRDVPAPGKVVRAPIPVPVPPTPIAGGHVLVEDCRRIFSPLTALPQPPAAGSIYVQGINWANDDVMTLDQLVANGLIVTLNQARPLGLPPAPLGPVNSGNFIVTIEPLTVQQEVTPKYPTIIRTVEVLDVQPSTAGHVLSWRILADDPMLNAINEMLILTAASGRFARVRVRLLGRALFAIDDLGAIGAAGPAYLDGRALGQAGTRSDGTTPRIDLRFPSGDGSTASDLESWFYLAPRLIVTSVLADYPALAAAFDTAGNFTGVEQPGTAQLFTQMVTIELSHPATVPVTVGLALSSADGGTVGVGTVASIQASVVIPPGCRSARVVVPISASPGDNTTLSFQVTSSLTSAVAGWSSTARLPQPFTVAGRTLQAG